MVASLSNASGGIAVASIRDSEGVHELEFELEDEFEDELEGEGAGEEEGIFGTIGSALSGLLGEGEGESHEAHEHEFEEELEGVGHEFEEEGAHESHEMHEFEDESSELFFGRIGRALRRVARVAAPMVLRAVGGPLGGVLSNVAGQVLREDEMEFELESEYESGHEFEYESHEAGGHEYEAALSAQLSEAEATAEMMAAVAAQASSEAEAEAMIGAATIYTLSPRERRQLRRVLAHMVRGSAILTRVLRRSRATRPGVRAVPMIVHSTARTLTRGAVSGRPITRRTAGRVMAMHTRRVLGNPHVCRRVIRRNAYATRRAGRQVVGGYSGGAYRPGRRVRY
jgi:hypothetical protein